MKCSCGKEHRLEINEKEGFQTLEEFDRCFVSEFPWAISNGERTYFVDLDKLTDTVLIKGEFGGEMVAYALVVYSSAEIFYIQRKPEGDRARFGFHNDVMEHILARMPKDRNIDAIMPMPSSEKFLSRFGFEPSKPENYKPGDILTRWVLRRR